MCVCILCNFPEKIFTLLFYDDRVFDELSRVFEVNALLVGVNVRKRIIGQIHTLASEVFYY